MAYDVGNPLPGLEQPQNVSIYSKNIIRYQKYIIAFLHLLLHIQFITYGVAVWYIYIYIYVWANVLKNIIKLKLLLSNDTNKFIELSQCLKFK